MTSRRIAGVTIMYTDVPNCYAHIGTIIYGLSVYYIQNKLNDTKDVKGEADKRGVKWRNVGEIMETSMKIY